MDRNFEERVRLAAFAELRKRQVVHGEVLPYVEAIRPPLRVEGVDIPLMTLQKGIHKPARLHAVLSVVTAAPKSGGVAPVGGRCSVPRPIRHVLARPFTAYGQPSRHWRACGLAGAGAAHGREIEALVADRDGRVLWHATGAPDTAAPGEIDAMLRALDPRER